MSALEKSVIPASITAGMDVDAIEIHKRKWTPFTAANMSVVRGTRIYYPNDPGPSKQLGHLAHLVHEIAHVWQYVFLGVGLYAPQWLDRRYHYHLVEGDRLISFGLEQQAAIVEDSFRVSHGLQHRWALNAPSEQLLCKTVDNCHVGETISPVLNT